MDLITVVAALPIGYLLRNQLAAFVTYIAGYLYLFTFQTLVLTREWVGGSTNAFPKDPHTGPWGYGFVNLIFFAAGFGLLVLGRWIADRRHAGSRVLVDQPA